MSHKILTTEIKTNSFALTSHQFTWHSHKNSHHRNQNYQLHAAAHHTSSHHLTHQQRQRWGASGRLWSAAQWWSPSVQRRWRWAPRCRTPGRRGSCPCSWWQRRSPRGRAAHAAGFPHPQLMLGSSSSVWLLPCCTLCQQGDREVNAVSRYYMYNLWSVIG